QEAEPEQRLSQCQDEQHSLKDGQVPQLDGPHGSRVEDGHENQAGSQEHQGTEDKDAQGAHGTPLLRLISVPRLQVNADLASKRARSISTPCGPKCKTMSCIRARSCGGATLLHSGQAALVSRCYKDEVGSGKHLMRRWHGSERTTRVAAADPQRRRERRERAGASGRAARGRPGLRPCRPASPSPLRLSGSYLL